MSAIYRTSGETIPYKAAADIAEGAIVCIGSLVGITKMPIKRGETGAICTVGTFEEVPKNGSGAITAGQIVYVNPANGKIYAASATGYIACGYALANAASTATVCDIYLVPTGQAGAAAAAGA